MGCLPDAVAARREETEKVAEAVRTEVTTLVKYAIGAVGICEQIKKGIVQIPRQDAHYIVKNFAGDPIIYPAIADWVGLLRHPHATAEFYMRILEAKVMVEMLRTKTDIPGIMYTAAPVELVTPQFAGSVADSLLTALQLARPIVADEEMSVGKPQFTAWVQSVVVAQIDDCLASAKETFPDAESFKFPPPPQWFSIISNYSAKSL